MKERELNRANIGVPKTTAMSGRATANEINRCLRTGKEGSFGRIASLTILRSLIAAGFVVALTPMPAQADEEERGRDKKFEVLEAKVESLQATVSALESQIDTLQKQLAMVQSIKALALGPFVSVVSGLVDAVNGPHIYFTGANIHIVSGSGSTDDNGTPRGLGNLIIGYDEDPTSYVDRSPFDNLPLSPLSPGDVAGHITW
jgi:cell division protein FtsB